jgi:HAD superfamily hydrolase (TIGR01484 family)
MATSHVRRGARILSGSQSSDPVMDIGHGTCPVCAMRYLALACDYDGTLAHHGAMDAATVAALERVIASGRRLVLVTGRQLDDLRSVLPRIDLFERVVAENGALLYLPAAREERPLAPAPSAGLVAALRERGIAPLSVGRSIVATWEPQDATVLETIRELGLELQVIFNKGAVMVLPSGVNKATGLAAALDSMGLSPRNAVGVGDAQNDHAFLMRCECAVAVANALPAVKDEADIVTARDHGAGVAELIDELLADDLVRRAPLLARHRIALGRDGDGREYALEPYGSNVLVAGTSGSGKSSVVKGLLERIAERGYGFAVIDPEGDYEGLAGAIGLGTSQRAPSVDEAMQLLDARGNAVLNLAGLPLADRPAWFLALAPRLAALRARTAQPHWIVIDEAHHLLPAASQSPLPALAEAQGGVVLISVHPDHVAAQALAGIDAVIALGGEPVADLRRFAQAAGRRIELPAQEGPALAAGEALVWLRDAGDAPLRLALIASRGEHRRHLRKYAEGELPPDRSFWFRGPDTKLKLRAQNLIVFLQMADGVDDATWLHHLKRGDYSRWLEQGIKDEALAREARRIEAMPDLTPAQGRALLRAAIERGYTLPA